MELGQETGPGLGMARGTLQSRTGEMTRAGAERMAWPAGLSVWLLFSVLGCLCPPKGTRSSSLTLPRAAPSQVSQVAPTPARVCSCGKGVWRLEAGPFAGVHGVGTPWAGWGSCRGWSGVVAGAGGQRGPLGPGLWEGKTQGREVWYVSRGQRPTGAGALGGADLVEGKGEGVLVSAGFQWAGAVLTFSHNTSNNPGRGWV